MGIQQCGRDAGGLLGDYRVQDLQKLGTGGTEDIRRGVAFGEGAENIFHYDFKKEG